MPYGREYEGEFDAPDYELEPDDADFNEPDRDEPEDDEDEDEDFDGDDPDEIVFAFPGGNSALRAATPSNPRNCPCPNCGTPNRLTPKDVALGYQCDACADQAERGGY